jgi:hypothetical protein
MFNWNLPAWLKYVLLEFTCLAFGSTMADANMSHWIFFTRLISCKKKIIKILNWKRNFVKIITNLAEIFAILDIHSDIKKNWRIKIAEATLAFWYEDVNEELTSRETFLKVLDRKKTSKEVVTWQVPCFTNKSEKTVLYFSIQKEFKNVFIIKKQNFSLNSKW